MMTSNRIKIVLALAAVVTIRFVVNVAAKDIPAVLPDLDGKPAEQSKPVKMFILMG